MTAARTSDGEPCLVLHGVSESGTARLGSIYEAHRRAAGPSVPEPVGETTDGSLVLRSRAVADLEQLYAVWTTDPGGLPYGQGVAFSDWLLDTMEAVHTRGEAFGALSWANVLVTDEGRLELLGLGDNFMAFSAAGVQLGVPGQCIAPELIAGEPATPTADVFTLFSTTRGLLARTKTPPSFREAVEGEGDLYRPLQALASDALAMSPLDRIPDIPTLRARFREIRALAPEIPSSDAEGLRNTLRALVRGHVAQEDVTIRLATRSRTVQLGAERVDLSRRGPAWRILVALAESHVRRPGVSMSTDALVQAGWPEEQIRVESGRARLYVAISSLRKMGFDDAIAKIHGGYAISHRWSVRISEE